MAGYIDLDGQLSIPRQFLEARAFGADGLAPVRVGNEFGFIDRSGALVIEPTYNSAFTPQAGVARIMDGAMHAYVTPAGEVAFVAPGILGTDFREGLAGFTSGNRVGFIDKSGAVVIEPQFVQAGSFNEGLAWVQVGDKMGFIDRQGNQVIAPIYDMADRPGHRLSSSTTSNLSVTVWAC